MFLDWPIDSSRSNRLFNSIQPNILEPRPTEMEIPTIMCSVVGTAHSGRTTFLQALGTSPSTEGHHFDLVFRILTSIDDEDTLSSLNNSDIILTVFSLTCRQSFSDIETLWFPILEQTRSLQTHNMPHIFFIGTKCDLVDEFEVDLEKVQNLSNQFSNLFFAVSSTEGENIKLVLSLLGTVGKRVVESQEEDRLDLSNQEPKPIVDPVQNSGDETPSMKRRKHGHCRTPSPRSISPSSTINTFGPSHSQHCFTGNTISFTNKSIAGFEKDEEGKMSTIYSFSLDNRQPKVNRTSNCETQTKSSSSFSSPSSSVPLSELGRTHHHNKTDFSVCRQSLPRIVIHIPPVRNESTTDKEYLENDSRLSTLSQEQQRVGIIHAEIEKGIVIDVDVFADTNPEMLSSDIQRKHRLSDEQRAELQSCVQGILRRRESRHSPAHNSEQHGTATTQPQSSTNLHRTDGATPPTSPFSSGDRRRKNTDTQNQVLFRIDVELEGGKTARVVMKKGDNAKRVADAVCVQHKLTGKSAERMTHMITGYAKLVKQKKA